MRQLTIVLFDAGGGHRNAAEALKATLESQEQPWEVTLLNLQELLDSIDVIRRVTGVRIQDGYNLILRKGWTRPTPQLLIVLRALVRLYHAQVVNVLKKYWSQNPADLVLSVIPLFNRALAESIHAQMRGTAFTTLLTDFADCPPNFWIELESEYIICGTERAKQQALAAGHHRRQLYETSGMVMKRKFYQNPVIDRAEERERLGLDPNLPTGLVLFGGHGAPVMANIARSLDASPDPLQLIMICGHNQKLCAELSALSTSKRVVVQGFTSDIAYFMSLADFFIGKPGPGSISEALQFNLPVIVECNDRTMPQERYNAQWVQEKRLGIVLNNFRDIAAGVHQLLDKETFDELKSNAERYTNRALFEIPVILDEIFDIHSPRSVAASSFNNSESRGPSAAWAIST